ncbi:copper homeostasis protein CutC [Tessaracoccus sp. OH4464_COT-324]|uniref:copper homeostasis protein CutC n=1 Tax=Tessaracoccus sp. OH4464_COT-324 TaxID=2491059 RepID=UPI000F6330FE|nr:copper homeostasis protein CutC [Tessaracoccus sp. OH4464_COT-324]RRD46723.1 copper homeostasis protein CutC [Tessaracoccus sp. OH4464_COT-324]
MALLEVIAMHASDARNAEEGGADRVELVGTMAEDGLSPEPRLVDRVRLVASLEVRPMLRLRAGFGTDGGEVTRLKGLMRSYMDAGANGVVVGFLNRLNQIDMSVMTELMHDVDVPYTFHRAIDYCLDPDEAWGAVQQLPGRLTQVLTAGSTLGVEHGLDDLIARARNHPEDRELMMAGGGLAAEHVPWLIKAGVRAFHIGSPARPDRSWKAYVDAGLVHSWRTLIDDLESHEAE